MHIIPSTVLQSRYAEEVDMKIWIHADDYGITADQALSILALSSSCGGTGALNSVSAFANSPAFQESAQFAHPFVESKALSVSVHINLVEGPCVSDPSTVPLLVNERGTFAHDFAGLVKLGKWETREAAYEQVKRECIAQIERFLQAFPTEQRALNVDSHQHVHMIPFVFDALVDAAQSLGCHIDYLRIPVEPVTPVGLRRAFSANGVKNLILNHYAKRNLRLMPAGGKSGAVKISLEIGKTPSDGDKSRAVFGRHAVGAYARPHLSDAQQAHLARPHTRAKPRSAIPSGERAA